VAGPTRALRLSADQYLRRGALPAELHLMQAVARTPVAAGLV